MLQHLIEEWLARLNHGYALEPGRLGAAAGRLGIPGKQLPAAVAYSEDRYRFGRVVSRVGLGLSLGFIVIGGLGWAERLAQSVAGRAGTIAVGLVFFAVLGLLGTLADLPFEAWQTFVIEQRHGFNRQSPRGFVHDRLKGMALGIALGAPLLAALIWTIEATGRWWWLVAWALVSGFSLLTAWLYPTLLAPLFNRFTPLPAGELGDAIARLAERVGFKSRGVAVMDASRRSTHGNAYFTGVFGARRIVLFDTLLEGLTVPEIVAVLAHELGHFKLHHVRWAVVRSVLHTGLLFWLMSVALPWSPVYRAFHLAHSPHAALVAFGLWLGLLEFLLLPLQSALSRRHEFAADAFALAAGARADDLSQALLKLREKSRLLPFSHPLYSRVYHSHPPLVERLAALRPTVQGSEAS